MSDVPITSSSEATKSQPVDRLSASSPPIFGASALIKSVLKGLAIAIAMVIVSLPAFTCRLERFVPSRDAFFLFWGQTFALVPGLPGKYIRKCFYVFTLSGCSLKCEIGFLTYIHDRRSQVGERVYIGTGVGIGWVTLGDGCLVASRASILSGASQHQLCPGGRLTPFDRSTAKQINIGADSWIGEGAIVMADVESHSIVGAGTIVTKPVPSGSVVAGNPARLIRRLVDADNSQSMADAANRTI
jgi:virginiamycin A acetyltransferase